MENLLYSINTDLGIKYLNLLEIVQNPFALFVQFWFLMIILITYRVSYLWHALGLNQSNKQDKNIKTFRGKRS